MLSTIFLAFSLIAPTFADHVHLSNRHHAIAKRAETDLAKRGNARFTFYDVGMGACGHFNTANQFIVALNSEQYGGGYPGPQCFKTIVIQYGGKTARATITDECPGCPKYGLDLSRGLFNFFADESQGVLDGSWYFDGGSDPKGDGPDQNGGGGGGDGGDDHTTSTKHTTRTTYSFTATTHSSTSTTKKTTSTSSTSTSTSTTSTSTSSTVKTSSTSTSSSSSYAAPTPSVPAATNNDGETIQGINKAFVDMNVMLAYVATAK